MFFFNGSGIGYQVGPATLRVILVLTSGVVQSLRPMLTGNVSTVSDLPEALPVVIHPHFCCINHNALLGGIWQKVQVREHNRRAILWHPGIYTRVGDKDFVIADIILLADINQSIFSSGNDSLFMAY